MASRIGKERGSVSVEESPPEISRPDSEVPERAKRRYFSAQYKLRVLEDADACRAPGEVGAGTVPPGGPAGTRRRAVRLAPWLQPNAPTCWPPCTRTVSSIRLRPPYTQPC